MSKLKINKALPTQRRDSQDVESEQLQVEWLKKKYRPAQCDSPTAKKIKFEDIQTQLASEFRASVNPGAVSAAIKSAFPCTFIKAAGKLRQKRIFGIEKIPEECPSTSAAALDSDMRIQLMTERG